MIHTANNYYPMSTATSIDNSGTGNNVLTKPAGTEVASIVPGKKWSVFVPSAVTFNTDFNIDVNNYTIMLYAKPEPGTVISAGGNEINFTGKEFTITNEAGDTASIPVRSKKAFLIALTHSGFESGMYVDDKSVSIPDNTVLTTGEIPVTLLSAGGIIERPSAYSRLLSSQEMEELITEFMNSPMTYQNPDIMFMYDSSREHVLSYTLDDIAIPAGEIVFIPMENNECLSFKVSYESVGGVSVAINDVIAHSGMSFPGPPDSITASSELGGTLSNIVVTEYYSDDIVNSSHANFVTSLGSGDDYPTHMHSDTGGNTGVTQIIVDGTANTISGWFQVANGTVLPGVTMTNGVLSGTGLYVNGKPYSSGVINDWYFLTKVGAATGEIAVDVPTHAIVVNEETLTAAQIDDLYESFFRNPTLSAAAENISISEMAAFVIASEWKIVASG